MAAPARFRAMGDVVLDDLDAPRVDCVDEIPITGVRRFQPWIDPSPVVAVVVETGAVLDGWGDPDGAEPQVTDVI